MVPEQKTKRLNEEEAQERMVTEFQAYGRSLEMEKALKYLGQFLTESDDNWMEVVANICKAQIRWENFYRIFGREGEDPQSSGNFYKAFVQAPLLFGL